jgi:hypothetical protein
MGDRRHARGRRGPHPAELRADAAPDRTLAANEKFAQVGCRLELGAGSSNTPGTISPNHWLKVSLHSVDANRDAVDERKRLRVFREHWGVDSGARQAFGARIKETLCFGVDSA